MEAAPGPRCHLQRARMACPPFGGCPRSSAAGPLLLFQNRRNDLNELKRFEKFTFTGTETFFLIKARLVAAVVITILAAARAGTMTTSLFGRLLAFL